MDPRRLAMVGGLWLLPLVASARPMVREHVLPERNDDPASRDATWTTSGDWLVSPATPGEGDRVAALASVHDPRTVSLQARGASCDLGSAGPWVDMEETFTGAELRVEVVDLEQRYPCAQIRMSASDDAVVGDLQWELLDPAYPDAGPASRSLVASHEPQAAIPSELETIGVITREEWNARPTQCSTPEDDWYRMAIHHTAGPQTAGGSVIERLQGTQAYAMDSGGFCDIPYQMLVGFDGSLYEGRGLSLFSGATGGGNNPGNLAVCFIGCYHTPDGDCVGGVGHEPTDEMMDRGQLLIQTLVRLEDIPTSESDIRGHRDWPGNSTVCPGELLHPRLGELREDLWWFSGVEVERSWEAELELELPVETPTELWIDLENTGGLTWMPGETFLAPTPRDEESPLYDAAWPSTTRAATVEVPVEPGEVGRFALSVTTVTDEPVTQTFGLVHEGVTWFADPPWGGGPTDDAVEVTVRGVIEEAGSSSTSGGGSSTGGDDTGGVEGTTGFGGGTGDGSDDGGESGKSDDPDSGPNTTAALPPASAIDDSGCGCRSEGGGAPWVLGLFGLLGLRRRRRR